MNERSINQAALPPVPRWNRRRLIIAIVAGIVVVGAAFVIDLPDLGGTRRLQAEGIAVHTLIAFVGH